MPKIISLKYLKHDFRHFLVSSSLLLFIPVFYLKYGFYGWPHLLSVLIIQYSIFPLDDWLDRERAFPYYTLPFLTFAFYYFPLITVLAMLGIVIVNLRALVGKDNFIYERLEALGNLFIYVTPLTLPVGLNDARLYLAACLFLLFGDSFHKLGHQETKRRDLAWASGLLIFIIGALLFIRFHWLFYLSIGLLLISLLPFKIIKSKFYRWLYTQFWIGFSGVVAFNYYLSFFAGA